MTSVPTCPDAALVEASLAGNRDAFGHIVSRYQSLICSLAYSATGSLTQSEDLAQETFLAAWKSLADLREPAKLRAWLCGITRNLIHSTLRGQGREPSHWAEPLDHTSDNQSSEPLPLERAISQEETQILWRALEGVPETYRTPLVLYYREHQSIESVAQSLDLTEETVRQRLSRGRKLLHQEVRTFVESALERTSPGKGFTLTVLAAIPVTSTSAKAATVGAVVKGGTLAKVTLSSGALASAAAMMGAVLFSWKTAVDDTRSPAERRLMQRVGWANTGFLVLLLGVGWILLPQLAAHPVLLGIMLASLILASILLFVLTSTYLNRRRLQIASEDGTLESVSPATAAATANRKAFKLIVPSMILVASGLWALPWGERPLRSIVFVAGEIALLGWAYRRFQRLQRGEVSIPKSDAPVLRFLRHPLVLAPAILFGSALLAGLLPFYLTGAPLDLATILRAPGLRLLGWSLLGALLAYAVFALIFVWKGKPFLFADSILEQTYAPFFAQRPLSPEQMARLKELLRDKATRHVPKAIRLLQIKMTPAQRAKLIAEIKSEAAQWDARIRECLGDENTAALLRFETTIPDRTAIRAFSKQAVKTGHALTRAQEDQLLSALSDARSQSSWSTGLSRREPLHGDYAALLSPEILETWSQEEERFDQQFLTIAAQVLDPEQLTHFKTFQASQRQSQIAGYKLAAKMLS